MRHLTAAEEALFARSLMEMLDDWGVPLAARLRLLALEGLRARQLSRFYQGTPLPQDPRVQERVEHLVGIDAALHTSYPRNPAMARHWLHRRNRRFGGRSPLAAMVEDGLAGIRAVRVHLDCAWDWAEDERRARS